MPRNMPRLIMQFHCPNGNQVPISVVAVGGNKHRIHLQLPFAVDQIILIQRALDVRQYPDYPNPYEDRFFHDDDDQRQVIAELRALGLWDGTDTSGVICEDVHERVGRILGTLLDSVPVLAQDISELQNVATDVGGGEIVLWFDQEAVVLAALPWESARRERQALLLTGGVPLNCVRMIHLGKEVAPTPQAPRAFDKPLRILILAPQAGFTDSTFRKFESDARQHMREELHNLNIDILHLSPVTMADLEHILGDQEPFDILDYYGHGSFSDGLGKLQFDGSNVIDDWVDAQRLAQLPKLPNMIVLHACQSAQTRAGSPIAGIAPALNAAGVRAIVAMQSVTRMTAATDWIVPILYRYLASGASIQQAIAQARRALFVTEQERRSWFLPVIYVKHNDLRPVRLIDAVPPTNPFAGEKARGDPKYIVGYERQREKVWQKLTNQGNLTIIGPPRSGKTMLLNMIAAQATSELGSEVLIASLHIHEALRRIDAEKELIEMLNSGKRTILSRIIRGKRLIVLLDGLGNLDRGVRGLEVRQWLRGLSHLRTYGTVVQLVATSQQPLDEIFINDHPMDGSPLHASMRDLIEVDAFDPVEARVFLASRLVGTPFTAEDFVNLKTNPLNGSLIPGKLEDRCLKCYDELCQPWEDSLE